MVCPIFQQPVFLFSGLVQETREIGGTLCLQYNQDYLVLTKVFLPKWSQVILFSEIMLNKCKAEIKSKLPQILVNLETNRHWEVIVHLFNLKKDTLEYYAPRAPTQLASWCPTALLWYGWLNPNIGTTLVPHLPSFSFVFLLLKCFVSSRSFPGDFFSAYFRFILIYEAYG